MEVREGFLEDVPCKLHFKVNIGICKRKTGWKRKHPPWVREKHAKAWELEQVGTAKRLRLTKARAGSGGTRHDAGRPE